ncbi:TPA: flippase [Photobacterium damselae]
MAIKIKSDIIWLGLEKIILLISSLVFMMILANVLDKYSYGAMAYAQSFVGMLVFLVTLGFDSIVVKELVQDKTNAIKIQANVFVIRIVMFVFVLLLIFIYSELFITDKMIQDLLIVQSFTLTYYVFFTFGLHFQATINNSVITKARVIIGAIVLLVKLIMVCFNMDVIYYMIMDSVSMFLQGGVILFLYSKDVGIIKNNLINKAFEIDLLLIISLLKKSWPLMLTSASILIYARIDQFMVGNIVSIEELAKYSIAVKISESWYFIPSIISLVIFPLLISKKESNENEYNKTLGLLSFIVFWLSVICSIFIVFFLTPILTYIFENKYDGFENVVYILTLTGIFVALGFTNGRWLICEGLTKIELLRCSIGAVVNVILNYILIPLFGMYGAAISTLFSISISSYLILFLLPSTRWIAYFQIRSILDIRYYKSNIDKIKKMMSRI